MSRARSNWEMPATVVGRRLLRLMDHYRVNQSQMARLLGVNPSTVNRALRGTSDDATIGRALALGAARLGVAEGYWKVGVAAGYTNAEMERSGAVDPSPDQYIDVSAEAKARRDAAFVEAGLRPLDQLEQSEQAASKARQLERAREEDDAWRVFFAKLSSRRGDPAEVVREIMLVDAPADLSGSQRRDWWMQRYFEVLEAAGALPPRTRAT
jgi:transcriptional regulator with XRE-family HTH domain